jgi:2-polyprenyl-3-methyl-5-hydroxy-6-metoxy-1,4-benzoquinol methylase
LREKEKMKAFGNYSRYYNLLYKDKDYKGEAGFIHDLIQKYSPEAKNILDLGCGTGRHDLLLAEKGYAITGVDMSEEMLLIARSQQLNFLHGDIRTFRMDKKFDVAISLFHVMSYQTTNADFLSALETAKAHLASGGIFIFDFWYGPAVLTDRPAVRVKKLEDDKIQVIRLAEPIMHANKNLVDVNYTVWIKDKSSLQTEEIRETHHMRYWFLPEIEHLIKEAGFGMLNHGEWMTGKQPGFDTWGVYMVARIQ